MGLTLAEGNLIVAAALRAAGDLGVHIGVVVVDAAGHVLTAQRDEAAYLSVLTLAEHKAFTAINFRVGTHEMASRIGSMEVASHVALADRRLVFLGGGLPIVRSNELLGGFGVSGASVDQDLELCNKAIVGCGFEVRLVK